MDYMMLNSIVWNEMGAFFEQHCEYRMN